MTETTAPAGGRADVLYVLCLLQVAFVLLGGLGELLLMGGSPVYLALPAAKAALLLVLAAKVVSGRRWALATVIVLQALTLTAVFLQVLVGLLPWFGYTVNLVGLLTNVALPAVMIALCARLLGVAQSPRLRVAQDPYAPAPLVTSATPVITYEILPADVLPAPVRR